jgi:HD-GYP domain-containing protein (c-di-GMP phosphodiesterase class II)
MAALLHDVGKIGVPDPILRKPARLTRAEQDVVEQHALLGAMILQQLPHLEEIRSAVGAHHERFDGGGYPHGLRGTDIPLLGRILAVADSFSAMTTDRPYRAAFSIDQATCELERQAGAQFDPAVVRAFLSLGPVARRGAPAELVERR